STSPARDAYTGRSSRATDGRRAPESLPVPRRASQGASRRCGQNVPSHPPRARGSRASFFSSVTVGAPPCAGMQRFTSASSLALRSGAAAASADLLSGSSDTAIHREGAPGQVVEVARVVHGRILRAGRARPLGELRRLGEVVVADGPD